MVPCQGGLCPGRDGQGAGDLLKRQASGVLGRARELEDFALRQHDQEREVGQLAVFLGALQVHRASAV